MIKKANKLQSSF